MEFFGIVLRHAMSSEVVIDAVLANYRVVLVADEDYGFIESVYLFIDPVKSKALSISTQKILKVLIILGWSETVVARGLLVLLYKLRYGVTKVSRELFLLVSKAVSNVVRDLVLIQKSRILASVVSNRCDVLSRVENEATGA